MDKKNLDELFQEKFKDFRDVPDEKVWNAIEDSLDRKKRKRVIPIWWKLGGAAAVLAIALIAINPFSDKTDKDSTVTDIEKTDSEAPHNTDTNNEDDILAPESSEGAVVESSGDTEILGTEENQESGNAETLEKNSDTNTTDTTNKTGTEGIPNNTNSEKTQLTTVDNEVNGEGGIKNGRINKHKNTSIGNSNDKITVVATETKDTMGDKPISDDENPETAGPKKEVPNMLNKKENEAIIVSSENERENPNSVQKTDKVSDTIDTDIVKERMAISSKGKVAQNDENSEDTGSADPDKKSIFEAIEEQEEEEVVVETSAGRWSAGPSVAPVFFSTAGQGSPIDSDFATNPKSGSTNLSYGLSVAYEINKKLRIRSGIHKVDYGYDTEGIEFSASPEPSSNEKLKNIDYAATSKNLVVASEAIGNASFESLDNSSALELGSASAARNGTMAQQFGYLEVPVELDYALIDRKFGVNIVGGISSLFLLDNSVTLTSGDLTTEVGEANNVNNLNFSTNIGFGVNYKFTSKIQLNIEPVFKYQLNTFSNVSGDFRPFTVGVYSGLNFKF